ncbi:hypothetical protein [Priestia koreensis]|uniref:hypothetical protein n=1 Tax=Priestia koreensis TaxID=284581 RepID=UPI001F5ABDCF|nr:hypothetical protein [Priestia koreensis]UNL86950.1 hypothetical protein IE339_10875 [Priestia koreensis]
MARALGTFLLTTIVSFFVMVGVVLLWFKIEENRITDDPTYIDGVGFGATYVILAAVPLSLIIGILAGIIRYIRK